jgi:hypothetical protein
MDSIAAGAGTIRMPDVKKIARFVRLGVSVRQWCGGFITDESHEKQLTLCENIFSFWWGRLQRITVENNRKGHS